MRTLFGLAHPYRDAARINRTTIKLPNHLSVSQTVEFEPFFTHL